MHADKYKALLFMILAQARAHPPPAQFLLQGKYKYKYNILYFERVIHDYKNLVLSTELIM